MGYFDTEKNVDQYLSMAEGYDGAGLVAKLQEHLAARSTVLELGMGGGKDLELLSGAGFLPIGSDSSEVFLRRYKEGGGRLPTILLDACTLDTDLVFDAIYSNKVLHHLTREEMRLSLLRQAKVVRSGGLLFHSLWLGDGEEEHHGLLFTKYTKETLSTVLPSSLELLGCGVYTELETDDSLWILIRRSS